MTQTVWVEESLLDADEERVLVAVAGPYTLMVAELVDGTVRWSCSAGEIGELDELDGEAPSVAAAKRFAIEEARHRWNETGEALGALEGLVVH